MTHLMEYR